MYGTFISFFHIFKMSVLHCFVLILKGKFDCFNLNCLLFILIVKVFFLFFFLNSYVFLCNRHGSDMILFQHSVLKIQF